MAGHLYVSVSGIRAETLDDVREFTDHLAASGVPVSLLVRPRHKHGYRLAGDHETVAWLRDRRSGDDAVVLHGYDQAATRRRRAEFAVIDTHEATLRLAAADRVLETCGLRTRLFAAPRWTCSPGALRALPDAGFRVNLGFTGWDDVVTGEFTRARVLGFGDGFRDDAWWCRMVLAATTRTARRRGVVRLAISGKQLADPLSRRTMLDGVELARLHGLEAVTYRRLSDATVRRHVA